MSSSGSLTETEKAYAAGLIDGEGCIRVAKSNRKRTNGAEGRMMVYYMTVQVNSTTKPLVDFLRERWGGSLTALAGSEAMNRKPKWHWQVSASIAAKLLEDVYPFLVVKKEQAMFARAFQAMQKRWGAFGPVGNRQSHRPPEVLEMQERIFQKTKQLNTRGFVHPTAAAA